MTPRFISVLTCGLLFAVNAAAQEAAPAADAPAAAPADSAAAPAEAAPAPAAEAAPAEAAPAPAAEAAPAEAAPTTPPGDDADKAKDDGEGDMGGILIGLKLSLLLVGSADVTVSGVKSTVPSRTDYQIVVPLNFGGSGFGFDLQPSIGFGDVTSFGLYLGPAYHLGIKKNLYVNFGIGPQVRYLSDSTIDMGADIQARIPVGVTYYAQPDLGLFAEIGLGYGATGYKAKVPAGTTGPAADFHLGTGTAFDFGIGVRYP
ncbi:MAG TPA: hypothetical protein VL137_18850 [Polyangiaceae bacterium]|nr:hypothetical protein [Polyangiaceae bacterium]